MPKEIRFRAWDKLKKEFRKDIALMGSGSKEVVRSPDGFNDMVNKWYKEKGELLSGDYGEIDFTDWYGNENIEISLFTGLKDKKGVEIYEGDIVRHYRLELFTQQSHHDINPEINTCIIIGHHDVVVFKEGSFRLNDMNFDYIGLSDIEIIKDSCGCVDDELCDIDGTEINESILGIEVIGNLYQNPELIQK